MVVNIYVYFLACLVNIYMDFWTQLAPVGVSWHQFIMIDCAIKHWAAVPGYEGLYDVNMTRQAKKKKHAKP